MFAGASHVMAVGMRTVTMAVAVTAPVVPVAVSVYDVVSVGLTVSVPEAGTTPIPLSMDAVFAFDGDQVTVNMSYNERWGSPTEPEITGTR